MNEEMKTLTGKMETNKKNLMKKELIGNLELKNNSIQKTTSY